MAELLQALINRPNFVVFVVLFLWGIYIMAAHPNYVKKLIGLYIVQTSVLSRRVQRQGWRHCSDRVRRSRLARRASLCESAPTRPHGHGHRRPGSDSRSLACARFRNLPEIRQPR